MTETKKSLGHSYTAQCPTGGHSNDPSSPLSGICIGFMGAGAVAKALAAGFWEQGFKVTAISSRGGRSAEELASKLKGCFAYDTNQGVADGANLIFIATPDDEIARVASDVNWHPGQWVAHCSGAHSVELLEPARKAGCAVASFHPLQSFTAESPYHKLRGITFAIEAEGKLLEALKSLALGVGARWVVIQAHDKALYHLSASLVSNYLVTLVNLATELWQEMGFSREEALTALLPLIQGTVDNLGQAGLPHSLTGPISRQDTNTVMRHLEALQEKRQDLVGLYCELATHTLPLAREKGGLSPQGLESLKRIIAGYQGGDSHDQGS